MSWLDGLIAAALAWGGWSGWRRGLVREACHVGAAFVGAALALRGAASLAASLDRHLPLPAGLGHALAFAVLLVGVSALGYALEPWLQRAVRTVGLPGAVDRWGGAAAGVVKGACAVLILVVGLSQLPWPAGHRALDASALGIGILRLAPALFGAVRDVLPVSRPGGAAWPDWP